MTEENEKLKTEVETKSAGELTEEDIQAFLKHVVKRFSRNLVFISKSNNFDEVFVGDFMKNFISGTIEFEHNGEEITGNATAFVDGGIDVVFSVSKEVSIPLLELMDKEVKSVVKALDLPMNVDAIPPDIAGIILNRALEKQVFVIVEDYLKSQEEKK